MTKFQSILCAIFGHAWHIHHSPQNPLCVQCGVSR